VLHRGYINRRVLKNEDLDKEYKHFLEGVENGTKLSVRESEKVKYLIKTYNEFNQSVRNFYYSNDGRRLTHEAKILYLEASERELNKLKEEYQLIINKLIPNKELRERCINYGLCGDCRQPNTEKDPFTKKVQCKPCNSQYFLTTESFEKLRSGNQQFDDFIKKYQAQIIGCRRVLK